MQTLARSQAAVLEQVSRPSTLRVAVAGRVTAMAAPGGGEVQLQATTQALCGVGIDAVLWRPWEQPLEEFQLLHVFGSAAEHLPLVHAAKKLGLRVALSTIAWYDLACSWREPGLRKFSASAKFLLRAACPWIPAWRRRLYHAVDLLLPNSQAEAEQLQRYFGVPSSKIVVVPNGADERFAAPANEPLPEVPHENYVLYAGRIESRKNQLGFLRAMRGSGIPLVIVGDVVPGYEDYFKACQQAADESVTFLGRIPHGDRRLESLYARAGALCLASWFETPGLVALEAGMSGVPLVLPIAGAAPEYFGELAQYVHSNDRRGIRAAVERALARGRDAALADLVRRNFTWSTTAQRTGEAYACLA